MSADTVVPNFADPQSLNRFAYVRNNPLKYIDPSGHDYLCGVQCEEDWFGTPTNPAPSPCVCTPPANPGSGTGNNGAGSGTGNNDDLDAGLPIPTGGGGSTPPPPPESNVSNLPSGQSITSTPVFNYTVSSEVYLNLNAPSYIDLCLKCVWREPTLPELLAKATVSGVTGFINNADAFFSLIDPTTPLLEGLPPDTPSVGGMVRATGIKGSGPAGRILDTVGFIGHLGTRYTKAIIDPDVSMLTKALLTAHGALLIRQGNFLFGGGMRGR